MWLSRTTRHRPAAAPGEVAVTVPRRTELDPVAERLGHRGVEVADDGAPLRTRDPWRYRLALAVAAA